LGYSSDQIGAMTPTRAGELLQSEIPCSDIISTATELFGDSEDDGNATVNKKQQEQIAQEVMILRKTVASLQQQQQPPHTPREPIQEQK